MVDETHERPEEEIPDRFDFKDSVRTASTGNVNLGSAIDPNPVDNVTLSNGDRVLLKDQTSSSENGIYKALTATDPTTWERTSDADAEDELDAGMYVWVEEGTNNGSEAYALTTTGSITLDTTALNFAKVSGLGQITAGTNLSKSGDTIDMDADWSIEVGPADDVQFSLGTAEDGSVVYDATADEIQVVDTGIPEDVLQIPVDGSGAVNIANRDLTVQGTTVSRAAAGTSTAATGFGTLTQISASRPGFVTVEATAETDGTSSGTVELDIDEDGGGVVDYTLTIVDVQPALASGTSRTGTVATVHVPAGGQYQITNTSDPNAANSINVVREGTR